MSHRLFWKLFLLVWLTLLIFAGCVVLGASLYLDHAKARPDAWRPEEGYSGLRNAAQKAATQGQSALTAWSKSFDADHLIPILVLNHEGRDLLGREISPSAAARFARMQKPTEDAGLRERRLPVSTPDGTDYWLVPDFQAVTLNRLVSRPGVVAVQLTAATLIGGLLCFLLAWYLLGPIEKLRKAALLYGAGDLSHRVAPTLGRRRDEIVDLAKTLDGMAEKIGALLQSHKTLLRDVSHELRSPLARAHAAASLARGKSEGRADKELDRIETELERLDSLIGQILSYSRLDTGTKAMQVEAVRLDQLLLAVAEDAEIEAKASDCTLQCAPLPEAPYVGDPMLIYSAINNVVSNAIRYAAAGKSIELALAPGEEAWLIEISDRGPGIAPDMLEQIFAPFVRIDTARTHTPRSGGAGLGLAIARRAIEQHNGSISAMSREGGGLTVAIRLPNTPVHHASGSSS